MAAICRRSSSSSRRHVRAWTLRICSRPPRSGRSTTTWRSNRPGRTSAGSSVSGRLVAAIRMIPRSESKPSISTSSWLSVWSRSSWAPGRPGAAGLADGVDLVDEDQAGGLGLGLGEQAPDPRGADADEHLHEVRAATGRRTGRRPRRRRPGQQGLAGARRADQQDALGDPAAELLVLLGRAQEARRPRAAPRPPPRCPATSSKVTRPASPSRGLALLLAKATAEPSPPPREITQEAHAAGPRPARPSPSRVAAGPMSRT